MSTSFAKNPQANANGSIPDASRARFASASLSLWFGIAFVTLVYIALILLTKPLGWGDTIVYSLQLQKYQGGLLRPDLFWDFAHLFWRPIGYLVWRAGHPYWSHQFPASQPLQVYAALQAFNRFFNYIAAVASFAIAWKLSRSVFAGAFLAGAFLCWNAFLNYFQTGSAYVPGLALLLVATYLLLQQHGEYSRPRAWLIGVLLALSVCLWLPDVFALPGIFVLGYLCQEPGATWVSGQRQARARWVAHAVLACVLAGTGAYAAGTVLAGVRSAAGLRTWVAESGHGIHHGKRYLRVATGLPRGLLDLGNTGIELKRLVLRDPYNPVHLYDLRHTSLWKLGVFYAGMAWLIWVLSRQPGGWSVLIPFLITSGLLLFLGLVLFEPGAPERWMPGYPLLLAALAYVFRRPRKLSLWLPVAAFLLIVAANNVAAYATSGEPGPDNPTVARVVALQSVLHPHDTVALLSMNDGIDGFFSRFPFHPLNPLNSEQALPFYLVTEPGTAMSAHWRESFAARALETWQEGGDIWISKRLLASRPLLDWDWAEGDDPYLRWRDISGFFTRYSFEGEIGGRDGFVRIARTPANEQLLKAADRASRTPVP